MTSTADRNLIVGELDASTYPSGSLTLDDAWLGIYQTLLWYEHEVPHIMDANDLLRSQKWRSRAKMAESFIADRLGVAPRALKHMVERMMKLPRWAGMQRNNPLGNGFRTLLAETLDRFGNSELKYNQEAKANDWFPGISLAGRSLNPRIDILFTEPQPSGREAPRAILSCKWSMRHDRLSDPTNECTQYKSASIQQSQLNVVYAVATSEMYDRRVAKLAAQPCVDYVVHTHLPLFKHLNGAGARFPADRKLVDLSEFVRLTEEW